MFTNLPATSMAQCSIRLHNREGSDHSAGRASVRAGGRMQLGWPGRRRRARHARRVRTLLSRAIWVVSAATAVTCGIVIVIPAIGAVTPATRMADDTGARPLRAPDALPVRTDGRSFDGTPAVRSEERRVGKECRSRW